MRIIFAILVIFRALNGYESRLISNDHVAYDELSPLPEMDIIDPDKANWNPMISMLNNARIWKDGIIPYKIDYDEQANYFVHEYLMKAIEKINEIQCVMFVPYSEGDDDYLSIEISAFMSSHIGRQGGKQTVTLDRKVNNHGSIIHELMHSLGFGHEHNRPDRDDSITVHFDNIYPDKLSFYKEYSLESVFPDNILEYDYQSMMHATRQVLNDVYIDPTKPIITRNDGLPDLGQRDFLTELDIKRIKAAYSCDVCKPQGSDNTFYRYPGDCTQFYQCANNIQYKMPCPAGTHFSLAQRMCLYPNEAACELPEDIWGTN